MNAASLRAYGQERGYAVVEVPPLLVDGGNVSVPTFRMYDPKGTWFAEGHGVEPDIEVIDDPSQLANGTDPQLARAIKEVQERIAKLPKVPGRPAPEKRIPKK